MTEHKTERKGEGCWSGLNSARTGLQNREDNLERKGESHALRTIEDNTGTLSKLSDFVHDRVVGVPVDTSDSRDSSVVVPFDIVAEQHRGREGANFFGEYFFPDAAQVILQNLANCCVDSKFRTNPFKLVNRMTSLVCQADLQRGVWRLLQIDIRAAFNGRIARHTNVVCADLDRTRGVLHELSVAVVLWKSGGFTDPIRLLPRELSAEVAAEAAPEEPERLIAFCKAELVAVEELGRQHLKEVPVDILGDLIDPARGRDAVDQVVPLFVFGKLRVLNPACQFAVEVNNR